MTEAAKLAERERIAALVLQAIDGKADWFIYGKSYALKINAERSEKCADAILALRPSSDPDAVRALETPAMQAVAQQAIMKHPHFDGSSVSAYGFAGVALKAVCAALAEAHRSSPAGSEEIRQLRIDNARLRDENFLLRRSPPAVTVNEDTIFDLIYAHMYADNDGIAGISAFIKDLLEKYTLTEKRPPSNQFDHDPRCNCGHLFELCPQADCSNITPLDLPSNTEGGK